MTHAVILSSGKEKEKFQSSKVRIQEGRIGIGIGGTHRDLCRGRGQQLGSGILRSALIGETVSNTVYCAEVKARRREDSEHGVCELNLKFVESGADSHCARAEDVDGEVALAVSRSRDALIWQDNVSRCMRTGTRRETSTMKAEKKLCRV